MSLMKKVKRANGEIVSVKEIFERNANSVKNYGMWLRYDSRSGTHNMYKEYRDLTLTGAVAQMYAPSLRTVTQHPYISTQHPSPPQLCTSFQPRSITHIIMASHNIATGTASHIFIAPLRYEELAGRHRARKSCIQIVRTATIAASECRRIAVTQFHDGDIKFKLNHRLSRPSSKIYRKTFKAQAPGSFF
jgi:ribosomal protein L20A (L18A)